MARKHGFDLSLSRQYDRLLAVLALAGLVVSLLVLARAAGESRNNEEAFRIAINSLIPAAPLATPMDLQPLEQAVRTLKHPPVISPSTNEAGLLVPERRVWCPDCRQPIPFASEKCPHCGKDQPFNPESIPHDQKDSDNDGIPDVIEIKWVMDPHDARDALLDADQDGFSNLEEWQAGTSAVDASAHPDVTEKLMLKEIRSRQFPFVFVSANRMPDDKYKCSFRFKDGSHDSVMVSEGATVGATGFVLKRYERKFERRPNPMVNNRLTEMDVSMVTVERAADGATFNLGLGDRQSAMEQEIVLVLAIGGKTSEYVVPVSGNLELLGEKYKVSVMINIDDKSSNVVIENIHTGKKRVLTVYK